MRAAGATILFSMYVSLLGACWRLIRGDHKRVVLTPHPPTRDLTSSMLSL